MNAQLLQTVWANGQAITTDHFTLAVAFTMICFTGVKTPFGFWRTQLAVCWNKSEDPRRLHAFGAN